MTGRAASQLIPPGAYPDYGQAQRRANAVLRTWGVWTGVRGPDPYGWYRVAFDPGDKAREDGQ